MIKANDLRLGNYILHDGNPYKVVRLNDAEVSFFNEKDKCRWTVTSNKVEPIELTPDVLGKILNCEKIKGREGIYRIGNLQLLCNTDGKALLYIHYDDGKYCYVRDINYLHQFQNAAFTMSDIELSITL